MVTELEPGNETDLFFCERSETVKVLVNYNIHVNFNLMLYISGRNNDMVLVKPMKANRKSKLR